MADLSEPHGRRLCVLLAHTSRASSGFSRLDFCSIRRARVAAVRAAAARGVLWFLVRPACKDPFAKALRGPLARLGESRLKGLPAEFGSSSSSKDGYRTAATR